MSIKLCLVLVVAVAVGFGALPTLSLAANPIVTENQQPGTDQWQIPNAGFQLADDSSNQIKGYTSATSANKGTALSFSVTVNPAQTFTIAFYRMGWYGGLGGRLMMTTASIAGVQQVSCPTIDSATRLLACNWSTSYTLAVPTSWTDGVYLASSATRRAFRTMSRS